MAGKRIKKEELNEAIDMYSEYFKDISSTYDELLSKSKKYLETTEKNIDDLAAMPMGTRGAQHYLTEHMENAAALISQCQSLADSKYKIKKSLLEYAIKDISNANDGQTTDYTATIAEIVKKEKARLEKQDKMIEEIINAENSNDKNLDDEIERILADSASQSE